MMKFLMVGITATALSACAGGVLPPPPATIPTAPSMDNTEMCMLIAENEKNLNAWVNYGSVWAKLFGVDLQDKIDEFTKNLDVLNNLKEARNVACVEA